MKSACGDVYFLLLDCDARSTNLYKWYIHIGINTHLHIHTHGLAEQHWYIVSKNTGYHSDKLSQDVITGGKQKHIELPCVNCHNFKWIYCYLRINYILKRKRGIDTVWICEHCTCLDKL